MPKKSRLPARATVAALVVLVVLTASAAEAFPQVRLRRWNGRPPIDPSIRATVRFDGPVVRPSRYRTPSYRTPQAYRTLPAYRAPQRYRSPSVGRRPAFRISY